MREMWEYDSLLCTSEFEEHSKYFGAVAPPIVQTSLFAFKDWDSFLGGITAERENYVYSRGVNPTVEMLEKKIAGLERGEKCKCFASGMAAISSTLFTLLESGDHVLFLNNVYGPAVAYTTALKKFGVDFTNIFVDKLEDIEANIKENTKLIYMESPSTMNMEILDLEAVSKIAKSKNILTAIDNTWATPLNQKPITLGIDLVLHSCTKFMGGHSDTVGGAVVGSYSIVDKIFETGYQLGGGVMAPFDAWLIMRGLRTLPQRMEWQRRSIEKFIEALKINPKIRKINHPLCYDEDKRELFEKQMNGYSSLFSVEVDFKDYDDVRNFMNAFNTFKLGVSWGGYESLVLTPNYGNNTESLEKSNISKDTVRFYIGLENVEILIDDLTRALDVIK
ncbi:MAG: trans-sulfuration enzyme family protein [Sarcina sp.]